MPDATGELLAFGWRSAEVTLAAADSERKLVTHWFQTGTDDSVNADDHFGSDERTLRFLRVALPTLVDQLAASAAVVALPWNISSDRAGASLTVVAISAGRAPAFETRSLRRLAAKSGPPYWRLEPGLISSPAELATVAAGLEISA